MSGKSIEKHRHHDALGLAGRRPAAICAALLAAALALPGHATAGDLAAPELGPGTPGASISQNGHGNEALVEQRGSGQFAQLVQDGLTNRLEVWQDGIGNAVNATQRGDGNLALVTQSGQWNQVQLDQNGFGNVANVAQHGAGRHALIEQTGNSNRIDLVQNASAPNVVLRQVGDYNVATLLQH